MRLVFIDTETGGLDPHSADLLTVALLATENGTILDSLSVSVKASRVTPEAMAVNGIDLESHNASAVTPEVAVAAISGFLSQHPGEKGKAVLAGHNVSFDRGFLSQVFEVANVPLGQLISHHMVDTVGLAIMLSDSGHPKPDSHSLGPCLKAWGLSFNGQAHTAEADAEAAFSLYTAMKMAISAK